MSGASPPQGFMAPFLSSATPEAVAAAGAAGSGSTVPRVDHVHAGLQLTSSTPAAVAGAGSVGVGTTAARSDHVHAGVVAGDIPTAYGSTPAAIAAAGSAGTSGNWAKGDHVHAGLQLGTSTPAAVAAAGSSGSASVAAKEDHVHAGSGYLSPEVVGDAAISCARGKHYLWAPTTADRTADLSAMTPAVGDEIILQRTDGSGTVRSLIDAGAGATIAASEATAQTLGLWGSDAVRLKYVATNAWRVIDDGRLPHRARLVGVWDSAKTAEDDFVCTAVALVYGLVPSIADPGIATVTRRGTYLKCFHCSIANIDNGEYVYVDHKTNGSRDYRRTMVMPSTDGAYAWIQSVSIVSAAAGAYFGAQTIHTSDTNPSSVEAYLDIVEVGRHAA